MWVIISSALRRFVDRPEMLCHQPGEHPWVGGDGPDRVERRLGEGAAYLRECPCGLPIRLVRYACHDLLDSQGSMHGKDDGREPKSRRVTIT
jgi:hypothetical protein